MVERGRHLRFAEESPRHVGIGGEGPGQLLDRDLPAQLTVDPAVDHPGRTPPELAPDLVAREGPLDKLHL